MFNYQNVWPISYQYFSWLIALVNNMAKIVWRDVQALRHDNFGHFVTQRCMTSKRRRLFLLNSCFVFCFLFFSFFLWGKRKDTCFFLSPLSYIGNNLLWILIVRNPIIVKLVTDRQRMFIFFVENCQPYRFLPFK